MCTPPDRETWRRISALLDEAFELQGNALDSFLAKLGAESPPIRDKVEAMLKADARTEGMLDENFDEFAAPLLDQESDDIGSLPPGTTIGNYRIVSEVGHGGMGRVYEAERADGAFDQTVALKVIRAGMSWGALRDRFLQERQILASLDHPNLARLLDGGVTEDGRPYFVMEYVEGLPITDFVADRDMPLRQRLALFKHVCEVVAHAQRRLVVHRDLKPSNILVNTEGEVKLLDFGIARMLGVSEEEGLTQLGPRLLTPEYAAPEQIQGGTITTATDVFALGCVLAKIVAGPGDGDGRTEVPRDIRRIIDKARSEDPELRYAAAAELGEDIGRFLAGFPIKARRPSLAYVGGRFVRRNTFAVGAALVILLTLVAGIIATTWQAQRAESAAGRATEITSFLISLFEEADPDVEQGQGTTAAEILARGAERVESELASEADMQAELHEVIGEIQIKRGDYAGAAAQFQRALSIRESQFGADHPRLSPALAGLGEALLWQSEYEQASVLYQRALNIERQRRSPDPAVLARAVSNMATVQARMGKTEEVEALYREALDLDRRAHGERSLQVAAELDNLATYLSGAGRRQEALALNLQAIDILRGALPANHSKIALHLHNIGHTYLDLEQYQKAEEYLRDAVAMRALLYQGPHPRLASSQRILGTILMKQGSVAQAEALFDESIATLRSYFGDVHSGVASALNDLAIIAYMNGDLAAALGRFRESLAVFEQILPPGHSTIMILQMNIGRISMDLGDLEEAHRVYSTVLEARRSALGDEHPYVAESWFGMATVYERLEEWDHSLEAIDRALAIYLMSLEETAETVLAANTVRGRALIELERFEEAEGLLDRTLEKLQADFSADHPRVVNANIELARVLMLTGRAEEALPLLDESLAARRDAYGDLDGRTGDVIALRGQCLLILGRRGEARTALQNAVSVLRETRGAGDYQTRRAEALAFRVAPN